MMNLETIVRELDLEVISGEGNLDRDVSSGYVSDMLSDVLANATADCVWITRQSHQNVIAVASLLGISAIVFVNCPPPGANMISKAVEESIPLLMSRQSAYEVAGRLFSIGLGGARRD
jgi:serine kinase of HPr protein (carbohydrate metabolism regulator)